MLNDGARNMPGLMPVTGQSLNQFRLTSHRIIGSLRAYGWVEASSVQKYLATDRQVRSKQIHCFNGTVTPRQIGNRKSRPRRDPFHPRWWLDLPARQYRSSKPRVRWVYVGRFSQTNQPIRTRKNVIIRENRQIA